MEKIYPENISNRLKALIRKETDLFPQNKLADLYKLFYQDYFGPGHYFKDRRQITHFLKDELSSYRPSEQKQLSIRSIRGLNDFVRLDLIWIVRGYISIDDLAELFFLSSKLELNHPQPWHIHWQYIQGMIKETEINFSDQEAACLLENAYQDQGIHHSRQYKKLYNPHYRLIDRTLWLKYQEGHPL